jgi:predicted esterase
MEHRTRYLSVAKTARSYEIGEPRDQTREVWICCHGYGQPAGRFIRLLEPLASPDRIVIAPEGLHRYYLDPPDRPAAERRVGATWMTRDDRDHDIFDYVRFLDEVCGTVLAAAPAARVVGLGFSQGAATIARWAAATEFPIARLVLWGAGLPPDLDWEHASPRLASMSLVFVIGDRDEYLTPERIHEHETWLGRHGIGFRMVRYQGGHVIEAGALREIAALDL